MSREPHVRDPDLPLKAGLLTVVAFLSWPIWLVWVSAHPTADAAVWWSGLFPLAITLFVAALWCDIPSRCAEALGRAAHAMVHAAHLDRHHHRHA
jgi:hypothetical protein